MDGELRPQELHLRRKVVVYYAHIIILLIFRQTINAETVMFAVVQLSCGAIIAVIKQYSHVFLLCVLYFTRHL